MLAIAPAIQYDNTKADTPPLTARRKIFIIIFPAEQFSAIAHIDIDDLVRCQATLPY